MTGLNLSGVISSINTILVQFSISNTNAVPRCLRAERREALSEKEKRVSQNNGIELTEKRENVTVASIIFQLKDAGFFLVDGCTKELYHLDKKGTYTVARFTFKREEVKDDYIHLAKRAFRLLSEDAFWAVKSYLNIPSEDGKTSFISINMSGRKPLRDGAGNLIMARLRDNDGNQIGEPVPIQPSGKFIFTRQGSLRVVAA